MNRSKTLFCILFGILMQNLLQAQQLNLTKYNNSEQTMTSIRIASASVIPEKWDKETNWTRIETLVRKAATEGGAQVIVTPEGALDGYVINDVNAEKDVEKREALVQKFLALGEPINGPYIAQASALSDELNVFLVLGFLERRNELLLNTAILIDPDGDIIGRYSKTHFAQGYTINPSCYNPGTEYPVFDTPFGKAGILICYDRQLPEPARIIALQGAQVMFYPSYGSYSDQDGWNTVLMRTRAYENRVPVIFSHPFQSLLIDEDGDLRAMGKAGEVVYYEINTDPARYENRFRNRRPETYGSLVEK